MYENILSKFNEIRNKLVCNFSFYDLYLNCIIIDIIIMRYYVQILFLICIIRNFNCCRSPVHSNETLIEQSYFDFRISPLLVPHNYPDGTLYLCQEYEVNLFLNFNLNKINLQH